MRPDLCNLQKLEWPKGRRVLMMNLRCEHWSSIPHTLTLENVVEHSKSINEAGQTTQLVDRDAHPHAPTEDCWNGNFIDLVLPCWRVLTKPDNLVQKKGFTFFLSWCIQVHKKLHYSSVRFTKWLWSVLMNHFGLGSIFWFVQNLIMCCRREL